MERGLAGVTLQDIAAEMHMRHVSLYYYIPNGKEELYMQVMERIFRKHYEGLSNAIQSAGNDFRSQIHAVAVWFATQPPLDLSRIVHSDLPLLDVAAAQHIVSTLLEYLRRPIADALQRAREHNLVIVQDVDFAAMGLVALLQSIHNIPLMFIESQDHFKQIAIATADSLLDGWFKR